MSLTVIRPHARTKWPHLKGLGMNEWYSEKETVTRFGTPELVAQLAAAGRLEKHHGQDGLTYYHQPQVHALWKDRTAVTGRGYSQEDLAVLMTVATEFQPRNWLSLNSRWWRTPLLVSSNTLGNVIVGGDNSYENHCLELAKHHPREAYQALAELLTALKFEGPETEASLHNCAYIVFSAAEQAYTDPEHNRLSEVACAHAALMLRATAFNYLLFAMTREAPSTYIEAITGVPTAQITWRPSNAMDHYKTEALFTRALTLATLAGVFDPRPEFMKLISRLIAAREAKPQG